MRAFIEFYNDNSIKHRTQPKEYLSISDIHRHAYSEIKNMRLSTCTIVKSYDLFGTIITAFDTTFPPGPLLGSLNKHEELWESGIKANTLSPDSAKSFLFNDKTRERLIDTAKVCYKNACALLDDANILLEHNRLERSGSLAILSFEEFGKSTIAFISASTGRWDSALFNAMKSHKSKQAILFGIMENIPRLISAIKYNTISNQQLFNFSSLDRTLRDYHAKQKLDLIKQSLQYTDVRRDGTCRTMPNTNIESKSRHLITIAQKSKYILGTTLNNEYCDISDKISNGTRLSINAIHYTDGYSIAIKPTGIHYEHMWKNVFEPALHIACDLPYTEKNTISLNIYAKHGGLLNPKATYALKYQCTWPP